jgi:LmbE family N-acetylglucosaminyl deacetylase
VKRLLVLAPHTDDAEFGCGGLVAAKREAGWAVRIAVFCAAPPVDRLRREALAAAGLLGAEVYFFDLPVRRLPEYRQDVLDKMLQIRRLLEPDVVCAPSRDDVHQDHEVVAREALRAFKHTTLLGYELPWNTFGFRRTAYQPLSEAHVSAKLRAVACYESQRHRPYARPEYVRACLLSRGVECGAAFAEAFEVERMVL